MPAKSSRKARRTPDQTELHFDEGYARLRSHPLFEPLLSHAHIIRLDDNLCPPDGWAVTLQEGHLHINPTRRAEPEEWMYILAHCLLHLGFGHFQRRENSREWSAACDVWITRFLADLKLGSPPGNFRSLPDLPTQSEERLYQQFSENGIPEHLRDLGTARPNSTDLILEGDKSIRRRYYYRQKIDWPALLGRGLVQAATSAVNVAGGVESALGVERSQHTPAQRARSWFINSYPLLGALAAAFKVIEDHTLCARMEISLAAVDAELKEIYVNPGAGLDERECRFVMAHELLHVGLRHTARRQGRHPYLWNVACDYVINDWLVEMGVGGLPQMGVLYDSELKGESAEGIYDRIANDLRRYRKLATLRGVGLGDILERGRPRWWEIGEGVELDEFYRHCLAQGLAYHEAQGRGYLPAGLVEEINALSQPPIPWDVELARWFDEHFPPLEKMRTYARPSRRQSATPDIPRPSYVITWDIQQGRTFGVLLDTSGSMDRQLLAKALGTIASYSLSRDVYAVRVVFCDAATYDQGYLLPEDIAGRVQVRGRGGTILQPGIDLLERVEDFPKDGPVLIITDGYCDRLHIQREHAYLIPEGRHLPFAPRGPVFRIN